MADQPNPNTPTISSGSPELFGLKEILSDSPKVAWLKANGLRVKYLPARSAVFKIGRFKGATEEEVIAKFAKRRKLKLWYDPMKQFHFTIANSAGWKTSFRGDGETIADAFKDGLKNVNDPFRPNSSGKETHAHGLMVQLKDQTFLKMDWKEFENATAPVAETEFE